MSYAVFIISLQESLIDLFVMLKIHFLSNPYYFYLYELCMLVSSINPSEIIKTVKMF